MINARKTTRVVLVILACHAGVLLLCAAAWYAEAVYRYQPPIMVAFDFTAEAVQADLLWVVPPVPFEREQVDPGLAGYSSGAAVEGEI